MSIRIIEKEITIGSHLHDFIISEIETAIKNHVNGIVDATITLTQNTQQNYVHTDIHIHIGDQFLTHCIGRDHDAHKSIVMGIEKLKEQLHHPKTHSIDKKSQRCNHEHHDGFQKLNQQHLMQMAIFFKNI
jgi:ribosomal subunit interface protein